MSRLVSLVNWLLGITVFFLIASLAYNALGYSNFDFNYGFLRLKKHAISTGWYLPAFYSHVLISGVILLIGFFQINTRWSLHSKSIHRLFGRCYAYGILFFAAPGGLVMSLFINRGHWVLISFIVQSLFWFLSTGIAVKKIINGDIEAHRKWMLRSYALTFAAVTLRMYVFASSWSFDLSQPQAYGIIAWLSWSVNLLVIEIYLQFFSPKSKRKLDQSI